MTSKDAASGTATTEASPIRADTAGAVTRSDGTAGHQGGRRLGALAMLAAGVVILAGTAWVGWRTYQAYHHLQLASTQVAALQAQLADITDVDPAATSAAVQQLQEDTAAGRSAVDDPLYRLAAGIPVVGPNLAAIREVTVTVDSLATTVLPSLVEVSHTLRPADLSPKDGTIELPPIAQISPMLQDADAAVKQARDRIAAIDRSSVIEPIGDAVTALGQKLDGAADITGPGARIARLLPAMLGAGAPRTYLVVFQNPAELRATGGMFGSFALVRADQGTITIIDQGPTRNLGVFDPPISELSKNAQILYSIKMTRFPADVNFTPDFPTAARGYAEMYRLRTGTTVDGVLAVDPIALSYALKGSPPLIVDGTSITADNVVPTLLSTAYQEFDQADQIGRDDFMAKATASAFSTVMSGAGNSGVVFDGLRRAVDERRLLIYSTNESEQADIAQTDLAGILSTDPAAPSIGVFFNDGSMAKLDYYLSSEVHVTAAGCGTDGQRRMRVSVVLHYNAPASGLPIYVSGPRQAGQPYLLRTNVLVFAPAGGAIVGGVVRDGVQAGVSRGTDGPREVGTVTTELLPGASTELVYTVLVPRSAGVADGMTPGLVLTPGVNPWVTSVEPYRTCAAPTP